MRPAAIAALDGCENGFGPVQGLVNSAGIGRDVPFFDTSVELLRAHRGRALRMKASFVGGGFAAAGFPPDRPSAH
jgi:NAD(P)-dependent dehydrogenase (short-subunit alcohol dehydrogenase family)